MKINLISIEDALNNTGFRKISSYVRMIHPNTEIFYVTTANSHTFAHLLLMRDTGAMQRQDVEAIARGIADADIVGFSSMTHYATLTADIIAEVRRINPRAYIVWGGIHPIIEPEDAIKHADAICTGEGEFAFEAFLKAFKAGESVLETRSFWFNTPDGVKKNRNLPLMTPPQMDALPVPIYQDGEYIYKRGRGFVLAEPQDFMDYSGLAYKTVWSIGCPLKCTYCGNSKFIDYDKNYRIVRHSSPASIIAEIKHAISKHPHISTVVFEDDSFMALPMKVMEEFCTLFRKEIDLPFVITGLIPNYVREDKLELLVAAGMYRVRMGIQSGSENILKFYDRPTPMPRIKESCELLNKYHKYMIPPAYDIILDNPVETVEDNVATLDLLQEMPRPYTLNIFSLRVIPNTAMAAAIEARGIHIDDIRTTYTRPQPTLSNITVFALSTVPIPKRLYGWLRAKALPSHMPQKHYPTLMMLARFLYLAKRATDHILFMDFTVLSGKAAHMVWKLGITRFWHKHIFPRYIPKATPAPPAPEGGTSAPH
ncbi:B12-binding domain-containing radical SAM protein [Azospirillum doebereinerae]